MTNFIHFECCFLTYLRNCTIAKSRPSEVAETKIMALAKGPYGIAQFDGRLTAIRVGGIQRIRAKRGEIRLKVYQYLLNKLGSTAHISQVFES